MQIDRRLIEAALRETEADDARAIDSLVASVVRRTVDVLNGQIGIGAPDQGDGTAIEDNLDWIWVTVVLDNAADLGTGATSPITITHNFDLPVIPVPTTADSFPNVTWTIWRWVHGDRTGANAAPAASANAAHVSAHFLLGDTVTRDAIDLRFHSDIIPTAAAPLTVDLKVAKAVI